VVNVRVLSLDTGGTKFQEGKCLTLCLTVTEVNEMPSSISAIVIEILDDVSVTFTVHAFVCVSWEMIELSNVSESSQSTITKSFIVFVIFTIVDRQTENQMPIIDVITFPFPPT